MTGDKLEIEVGYIKESLDKISTQVDNVENTVTQNNTQFQIHLATESEKFNTIVTYLSKLDGKLGDQNADWRQHMQRTMTNEITIEQLAALNEKIDVRLALLEADNKAHEVISKANSKMWTIVNWSIGILGSLATITALILEFTH